jgi:LacI family transcriptional regulator
MVSTLRAGDRLPSITQLEKHFGVAKSTVEAAVGDLQAEGLIIRRQGAGTFVTDAAARSQRTGRMVITCQPLGQSVTIFTAIASALEAEMRRLEYDPMLVFEWDPPQRAARVQERWQAKEIDGFVHIGSPTPAVFAEAPGVVIGEVPDETRVHQVVVDNYGGGRLAGEHLWQLGHRRIAMIAAAHLVPGPLRFKGLSDYCRERGAAETDVTFHQIHWGSGSRTDIPGLESQLRLLLDEPNPPTAFFFANDHVAFPGLQTLLAWGYSVPDKVSVLTFDDTPGLASHTRPALSAIRMPVAALGALAVQTLHETLAQPSSLSFRRLRVPAELIVRESTGPASVG